MLALGLGARLDLPQAGAACHRAFTQRYRTMRKRRLAGGRGS
jgi:hypothetical protein